MQKLVTVVGNRPQFIKIGVFCHEVRKEKGLKHILLHTGQHYAENMSEIFFKELNIQKPHFNLTVGSGRHGRQTGRMLAAIEKVLVDLKPDGVIVYGDTNSTLAGALAAVKLHIPVAHVEAGLRSFNRSMPEEINRVMTDSVSDFLFAPTAAAVKNLRKEGIRANKIFKVGDVMLDVARHYGKKASLESNILKTLGLEKGNYILSTIHRAENTDDLRRLRAIFQGLAIVAGEIPVILPIHPRTQKALVNLKSFHRIKKRLRIIKATGYLDMIMLEKNARLIATDSGGVQKEAFFYKVPCVTLRTETEWVELVKLGWNTTVSPTSEKNVADKILSHLDRKGKHAFPYGRGDASKRIIAVLRDKL